MDEDEILARMLAALGGAVIGLERQWRQRMSGLRANTNLPMYTTEILTASGTVQTCPEC